jgi:raffinose/stachyose/melibiose transport system substrate-binding protein
VKRYSSRRRKCITAIVAFSVAASLAALGATTASARHSDNVNIRWMMFETPNLPHSYWQQIVSRFEAKNPGINVQLLPSPTLDRDGYAKQLLASGQFPDVLQSITLQDYAKQGLLYAWRLLNRRRGACSSPMPVSSVASNTAFRTTHR